MPKTNENLLYLYWDKALLLILAALAIYVVLTRVVSSPLCSDDSRGQKVDPSKMVDQITDKARELSRSLEIYVPLPPDQSATVKKVRQYLESPTAQLSSNPSLTAQLPDESVQAKTPTPTVLTAVNVRAQGGIGVVAEATTSRTYSTTTRAPAEIYWVTIAAEFPFQKQYLAFAGLDPEVDEQNRLDEEDQYFLFARLELERQQLQPDGSWSDPQRVNPYESYQETRPNIVQALSELYSLPQGYKEQDLDNPKALRQWLARPGFQEFIVRPEFLPLDGFEQWYWPQEPPETSDEQTTVRIFAAAIPRSDTAPKYMKVDRSRPRPIIPRRAPAGGREPYGPPGFYGPGPGAFPGAFPVPDGRLPGTVAAPKATRIRRVSSDRIAIPRKYRPEDAPGSIPIWVHDCSVEPGRTYQYRLRVVLFNPLCGSEQAERAVRRQGWLTGEWSQWSKPVKTLQDRYFFFTGVSSAIASKPSQARLQVYAWERGYWFTQLFYGDEGEAIGGPKDMPDPAASPASGTRRSADLASPRLVRPGRTRPQPPAIRPKIKVDFSTGWTIVEFNAEVQVKRPVEGNPDEFETVTADELVVKNDQTGQTEKRYSDIDKDDPQKQDLDERIKRQKEALRPATPPPAPRDRRPAVPSRRRPRGGIWPPGGFDLPLPRRR